MSNLSKENDSFLNERDVEKYYELNESKKEIERKLKELNENFHLHFDKMIGENEKGELYIGDYKIQRQIRQSHNFHDEKTVLRLEELNLRDCIQVIKKPDKDKINSAITLGIIDEAQVADCRVNRRTKAIVVKKI